MTLKKDASIIRLVDRLGLEKRDWVIVDHWEADRCAIGIATRKSQRMLVYVSTYHKPQGLYDYECEIPSGTSVGDCVIAASEHDVTFDQLLSVLVQHLGRNVGDR